MLHLLLFGSWFLGWGSLGAGLLGRLPRGLTVMLWAISAWCLVIEAAVLIVSERGLLVRAAALMALAHVS